MEPNPEFGELMPPHLIPVSEIDLKMLAEIYDEADVYLSIYLPSDPRKEDANSSFIRSRSRAIEKALSRELKEAFHETLDLARGALELPSIDGERGRIVFASAPHSFVHMYRIGVSPGRLIVMDTSPFLLPLARLRDDYMDFGLLLLDSEEARLFCVRSDVPEEMAHLSIDLMNKHKKGGWSQMRFNRLRRGAIKSFLAEVAEDMERLCHDGIRGVVLAGPGEAKGQLMEMLSPSQRERILATLDSSMKTPKGELVRMGDKVALDDERERSRAISERLRMAVLKGDLAAYGVDDVRGALEAARANILVMLKGLSIPGWICERCQNLGQGKRPQERCPRCGGPLSIVDLAEELLELALRTGAEVEFVEEDPFLESIGGVGALLRY